MSTEINTYVGVTLEEIYRLLKTFIESIKTTCNELENQKVVLERDWQDKCPHRSSMKPDDSAIKSIAEDMIAEYGLEKAILEYQRRLVDFEEKYPVNRFLHEQELELEPGKDSKEYLRVLIARLGEAHLIAGSRETIKSVKNYIDQCLACFGAYKKDLTRICDEIERSRLEERHILLIEAIYQSVCELQGNVANPFLRKYEDISSDQDFDLLISSVCLESAKLTDLLKLRLKGLPSRLKLLVGDTVTKRHTNKSEDEQEALKIIRKELNAGGDYKRVLKAFDAAELFTHPIYCSWEEEWRIICWSDVIGNKTLKRRFQSWLYAQKKKLGLPKGSTKKIGVNR